MAWTQADIAIIEAALARAELKVKFADREVTYRSVAELKQQLAVIKAEVNASTRTKVVKLYGDSGL